MLSWLAVCQSSTLSLSPSRASYSLSRSCFEFPTHLCLGGVHRLLVVVDLLEQCGGLGVQLRKKFGLELFHFIRV